MAYSEGYSGKYIWKLSNVKLKWGGGGGQIPSRDWTGVPEVTTVLLSKMRPKVDKNWTWILKWKQ